MAEYCSCGSLKVQGVCSNCRCPEINSKSHKWIIEGTEVLFKELVTYQEACDIAIDKVKLMSATIRPQSRDRTSREVEG